jgi:transposase
MSEKRSSTGGERDDSARRGKRFSDEFKRDAVRLVAEEEYTFKAAAAAVNVSEKSLRDWHARFAPKPGPCGDDATLEELRVENKRLRQQLKRAELEREILKKATAYFAKESL